MRTLDDALGFLARFTDWEQLLHRAPKRDTFDLGRIRRLLDRLGSPHEASPTVHVTGTKGKSSVVMMAEALLRGHGLRTFRFLSPHVREVTERMALDGVDVSHDTFVDLVGSLRPVIEEVERARPEDLPSFFEAMTAMGFLLARQSSVDVMVLEVGLGGRLDATNVVDPTVSVITSIALDHTRILGETVQQIAGEKAGILKPDRPAVIGLEAEDPAMTVIEDRARAMRCPIQAPGRGIALHDVHETTDDAGAPVLRFSGSVEEHRFDDLVLAAGSRHQAMNALCAIAAAEHVLRQRGQPLLVEAVHEALAALRLTGRCQLVQGDPPVLVDGAHTEESVEDLVTVMGRVARGRPVHLLCGLTRDRSPATVLRSALDICTSITATELPTPRTLPATELLRSLPRAADAVAISELDAALERAMVSARRDGGVVLATGSLYLAGEVLSRLLPCPA